MTMGLGFIFGNYVFLAADKRTTFLNADGSNGSYFDGSCKLSMLSTSCYVFCGGVTQATQPLIEEIMQEFSGKNLDENHISQIGQFCRKQYETFMSSVDERLKSSSWIKDFILSLILVQNIGERPALIRYDLETNFEPVIQSEHGALCVKSALDPEKLWPEIQKISESENQAGFTPARFINRIFLKSSEMDSAISPSYDVLAIAPQEYNNSLAFQKLTAGTITATISIKSPYISGGIIDGGIITGALFRTAESGSRLEMASTGINCYSSGNIKSGISINNDVNIGWGDLKFYHNDILEGGLQYNTSDSIVLYSRDSKHIDINSDYDVQLSPNRINGGVIKGIIIDDHVVGTHNHGIVDGTRLATCDINGNVTGYVQFVSSGAFILNHDIY